MNVYLSSLIRKTSDFLVVKIKRRALMAAILVIVALAEFLIIGLARRTFVFYTVSDGEIVVEDRMIKRTPSREVDIIRYVEETLLGPVNPDLLPLFPRETGLISLLYRDGVVFADLSASAALPPQEGGRVYDNFKTLYVGILRNFSYVRDVRFFIEGNAAYAGEFQPEMGFPGIFPNFY